MRSSQYHSYFRLSLLVSVLLALGVIGVQPGSAAAPSPSLILLVLNDASPNRYGAYLGEILRAEGLNSYETLQLERVTDTNLTHYRLVILAETPLSVAQAAMFRRYVTDGGRLIAMRPDPQIAELFGLGPSADVQTDGYLALDTAQPAAYGLPADTLQFHGEASHYPLSGATQVAALYTSPADATAYPAVAAASSGHGRTAAFAYDLATNVVLTRQGNPNNADVDTDKDGVLRTIDLFQATKPGDLPWVDLDRVAIPQADVQQRLFARLVAQLLDDVTPLPRLWYFPENARTMLVLTADSHGNPTDYYKYQMESLEAHHGTMTYYLSLAADPPDKELQAWRVKGYAFGIHPYSEKPDDYQPFNITSLSQGYDVMTSWFAERYTSKPSRTVRNHQVAWQGWTDAAELAVNHGMALDANFYHWGPWLQRLDGTWAHGYITGSGQPMKFMTADGTILPYYQQLTQLVDEQFFSVIADAGFERLDGPGAVEVSKKLIDASQAGDYAALMAQFHVDYYGLDTPQQWAEGTLDYAYSQGIPIWNADEWLAFTEIRNEAGYSTISWDAETSTLSFNLKSPADRQKLTTMVPAAYNSRGLSVVIVDGKVQNVTTQPVNGVDMAFISTPAGSHKFTVLYQAAPPATSTPIPTLTSVPTAPTASPVPQLPGKAQAPNLASAAFVENTLTQTTLADFSQACAVLADTLVTGDGTITLAGTFRDTFDAATLDPSLWTSSSWSGGNYAPILDGSTILLPTDGAVRSQRPVTHATVDVTAAFGAGPWQHIGFASDRFEGDRYLIFSTNASDTNLWARVNTGSGEQTLDMGPIPAGMHQYQVSWMKGEPADTVVFSIDGAARATITLSSNPTDLYTYLSNNGTADLRVDQIRSTPPYAAGGTFTSCALDAPVGSIWKTISWDTDQPDGTTLSVETRISSDGADWGAWSAAGSSGAQISSTGRFLQYRLTLGGAGDTLTPQVTTVRLTIGPEGPDLAVVLAIAAVAIIVVAGASAGLVIGRRRSRKRHL